MGKIDSYIQGDRGEISSKTDVKSTSDKESESPPIIKVQSSPNTRKVVKESEITEQKVAGSPKPVALTSEKPSLQSRSHHELLDKYCFVRSTANQENKPISS